MADMAEPTLRAPTWRDRLVNLPAQLFGVDYTTDAPGVALLKVLMALPDAGLATLVGPARYTIQRSAPALGRYLQRSPATVYAGFGPMPAAGAGTAVLGTTGIMTDARARALNTLHDILGGQQWPTPQAVTSGAFFRQTNPAVYQRLPHPLAAGDVEIVLAPEYDPTRRAVGLVSRLAAPPLRPSKSPGLLNEQAETAIHEGLHAAWLTHLPLAERQHLGALRQRLSTGEGTLAQQRVLERSANFPPAPSLVKYLDLDDMVRVLTGEQSMEHAILTGIAKRMAQGR